MIIIGGVAVGLALLQVIYLLEITFLTMLASQWHPIMLRSANGLKHAVKEWFKENMIIIGGVAVGLALLQVIYLLEITFLTMLASQWHPIMLRSANGLKHAVKEWFKENMIIIGGVAVGLALLQVIYLLEITFLTMLASQWHPIMLRSASGLKHLSHRELLLGSGLTWKMGS